MKTFKQNITESNIKKTLDGIELCNKKIQQLNEKLKSEMGVYKEIKDACLTIEANIDMVRDYS
jgi:hypothetical protein